MYAHFLNKGGFFVEISLRLKTIAGLVEGNSLADIGTDHAYIPIYLALNKKIERSAACDIKKGPLDIAAENINKYGLGHIIETRLGNGLEKVQPFEFETAVIAGMGGMLIADIMKASMQCAKSFKQLVLQPQLDIPFVRRFLHGSGFKIDNEVLVFDDNKYYNIIVCSKGFEAPYSEIEYMLGKCLISKKDSLLKDYILYKLNEINIILESIEKAPVKSDASVAKAAELNSLQNVYNEVIRCL